MQDCLIGKVTRMQTCKIEGIARIDANLQSWKTLKGLIVTSLKHILHNLMAPEGAGGYMHMYWVVYL